MSRRLLLADMLKLGSRLTLARALSLLTFPAIVFLYGPAPFGLYAAYLAAVNVAWAVMFARFELAIVPARDTQLRGVMAACLIAGGFFTFIAACFAFAAWQAGFVEKFSGMATTALLLLPASVALRGAFRLAANETTRRGVFRNPAQAMLAQGLVQFAVQAALALSPLEPVLALAIGDVAGAAAAFFITLREAPVLRGLLQKGAWPHRAEIRKASGAWAQLPRFGLPSALAAILAANLPYLVLPLLAGPADAGLLAFALRIFERLGELTSSSATPVLAHRVAHAQAARRPLLLVAGTSFTFFIAGAAMLALTLAAAAAAPWLTGTKWESLPALMPPALLWPLGIATGAPLITLAAIVHAERRALPVQMAFLALLVGVSALMLPAATALVIFGTLALLRATVLLLALAHAGAKISDGDIEQAAREELQ